MRDVATAETSVLLQARPQEPHPRPHRRQLLDDGLRLVVEGIVSSLPGTTAGIFAASAPAGVELVALAAPRILGAAPGARLSDSPGDDHAGGESTMVAAAVARAHDNVTSGVTTEVRRHFVHLALRDRGGRPLGLLFVATDETAPPLTAVSSYALITAYATQAEAEIRGSVEQQVLDERVRLAETARQVVRHATSRADPTAAVEAIEDTLREGFRADLVRVRTYASETLPLSGSPGLVVPTSVISIARATSKRLWAKQRVAVLEPGSGPDDVLEPADHAEIVEVMGRLGLSSLLLAPLGFRSTCYGHLVLGRKDPSQPWSDQEARGALEVGGDLGRAAHNLAAFSRERRLAAQMRALDSAKSKLIADVSHQLRDPLSTIVGHLELLQVADDGGHDGGGEIGESLHAMDRSAVRLRRIVEDLTLLARVGDPASVLEPTEVDLAAVAREVVDLVAVTADRADVDIALSLPAGEVTAWGDAVELDRALCNLVTNAVKYGHPGGRVEVGVERRDDEVVISCRDDGLGIAADDLPLLFTEFFRSTNPDALHRPGTGLGLAIVQRIAHRHGGQVEVTSRIGEGSEFRLRLPQASPAG